MTLSCVGHLNTPFLGMQEGKTRSLTPLVPNGMVPTATPLPTKAEAGAGGSLRLGLWEGGTDDG